MLGACWYSNLLFLLHPLKPVPHFVRDALSVQIGSGVRKRSLTHSEQTQVSDGQLRRMQLVMKLAVPCKMVLLDGELRQSDRNAWTDTARVHVVRCDCVMCALADHDECIHALGDVDSLRAVGVGSASMHAATCWNTARAE